MLADFSGELMGSKLWMGMLHDQAYRYLLNDQMVKAIENLIPFTSVLNESNIERFMGAKDDYFFKASSDFGGHGVLPGKASSCEEIRDRIGDLGSTKWIAQKVCKVEPIKMRLIGETDEVEATSVLGLYQIDGKWSGALVRAKEHTDVINVAGGSTIGWGFEVTQ
jgi:hypothetical protein